MNKLNNKKFISLILIVLGIFLSVYTVLNYQSFFSHAGGGGDYSNIHVDKTIGGNDLPVSCTDNVCETDSLDVNFQIKDINQFTNQ